MKNSCLQKTSLAVAVATVFTLPAMAEEIQTKHRGAATLMLEEVQVTARKRSAAEAVQDVPMAISAYSSDQLEALFVTKLEDLSYSAPNVQLEAVGTFPGIQNFSIRGQGINSSIPSVDPTVGVFVDGMYIGVAYGVVLDMFDLEAVEVLRGPQGLLFGRNVTGGAVSVRTARPDGDFGLKTKVRITDHDQAILAGAIKFPVTDNLAGKLVVYLDDDDGYFDNAYNGATPDLVPGVEPVYFDRATSNGKAGAMETFFVRNSWLLNASDDLELLLSLESGKVDGGGAPWARVDQQRGDAVPALVSPGSEREFTTTIDENGITDIEWKQAILEANLDVDFGDGRITNILGWRDLDFYSVSDVDASSFNNFTVPSSAAQNQVSNELRYAGTFMDNKWDVTTGLFYFQQDVEYREARYIQDGALRVALGGDMDHSTWAVFMNNDYRITPALTLTAGLRYSEEDKDSRVIVATTGRCTDVVNFQCSFADLNDSWSNLTPKLGASYHLSEDAQVYAFWTKGFRSGGVNFRNAKPTVIAPGPTKDEEQNSYEIGLKSDWLNGRFRFNAAYFYNTIDDMQRELNMPDPDVVVLQGTVNAGDAIIQGVEVDFVAMLADNFTLHGSVGYLDGKWDRINPQFIQEVVGVANGVGADLPRLSPWSANIGATYDVNLGAAGYLTFRGNYGYRDRAAFLDSNLEYFDIQHEVTASIDYTTADEAWKISLFGKNLNDETRWGNLTKVSFGTVGPMQKGRELGVEVTYSY